MKIIVFGASRGVGLKVVEQALDAGHTATAFVRSPEKFGVKHTNLTVFKGDSMDAAAVEEAIAGHEVVISALGPTRPPVARMMEISAKNIVAGMKKHGVRRLVSTTGAGVRQPEDKPKFADHLIGFLLNLLAKDVVLDSAENVKIIKASDLDWTIARYPRLIDGAHTRKYRVGYIGPDSGTQLSRADGADFVLKELTERMWLKKLPLISY
ncbi:MAG: SDR family oxidoreductase [Chloroflexi bacterium]|nr:SDR family oxidoreductase [Chloroflexota bacterium]